MRALRSAILATVTLASLGGCVANPYRGVSYPYVTSGTTPLTAEKVAYQDTVVQPRCEQVAKETTPSAGKMGAYYAFNHAQAGAVAGGAYLAELSVAGIANPYLAGGIAVAGAIQGAANGYVSGRENADAQVHNNTKGCIIDDAVGLHQVAPSEGRRIRAGKQGPTSYGSEAAHPDHRQPEN